MKRMGLCKCCFLFLVFPFLPHHPSSTWCILTCRIKLIYHLIYEIFSCSHKLSHFHLLEHPEHTVHMSLACQNGTRVLWSFIWVIGFASIINSLFLSFSICKSGNNDRTYLMELLLELRTMHST